MFIVIGIIIKVDISNSRRDLENVAIGSGFLECGHVIHIGEQPYIEPISNKGLNIQATQSLFSSLSISCLIFEENIFNLVPFVLEHPTTELLQIDFRL